MLFWIVCATLVAAIALALVGALLRQRPAALPAAVHDVQVYRDQLAEVEKDLARGVLTAEEAARTRLEVSRRLLEADRAVQAGADAGQMADAAPRGATVLVAGLVVAVLGGAFGLYQWLGAAGLPDAPLRARFAAADAIYESRPSQAEAETQAEAMRGPLPELDAQFTTLMERLRTAVAERPNDLAGLDLLAVNEMNMGNFRAGWEAQRRLVALKGAAATSADYARLGEFMTVAAGGLVTAEAEAAFSAALDRDRSNGMALYYLGMLMGQNERPDRAFRLWDAALRVSAPNDPWVPVIAQNIDTLAWLAGESDYTAPMPAGGGPTEADMAAAEVMEPAARAEMIRGMVEQLNARLANEGGTGADWARLISALRSLGEGARAEAILTEARQKFAALPEEAAQIEAAAQTPLGTVVAPEVAAPAPALPGPTADQVEAAGEMTPEERAAMIEGMVGGLVDRLRTEGGSPEEWARAIGSLSTLGKTEEAKAVLAEAKAAHAGNAEALAALDATAKAAGVAP